MHLANAMKEYAQLERQLEKNKVLVEEYDRKALLALKSGNEPLALEALKRKEASVRVVADLEKEVAEQSKLIDQLKVNFNTLEKRVDNARAQKNTLISKNRRAVARINSVKAIAGDDRQGQLLEAFDRMAAKIEDTEDMAVAIGMVTKKSFDEEFREIEQDDSVTQALDEMKARLGMKTSKPRISSNGVEDAQVTPTD
jgi:phage shock protein A